MKNIKRILLSIIVIAAVWGSFYTENLTEKKQREMMTQNNPEQWVATFMQDSLTTLKDKAVTLRKLAEGIATGHKEFAERHGRTLGIGSPVFYVVQGTCEAPQLINGEELQGTAEGVPFSIPLKYIFGNTARDASGWFNIDDFLNTMDFNAVSAALNNYIAARLKAFQWTPQQPIEFTGAVAIPADAQKLDQATIITYQLQ